MKLLKKLLPIASLASVAAIAAPLATSCSNSSLNSIEFGLLYDGEKEPDPYIAMFDPHEPTSDKAIDQADAQSIYLDKMEEDVRVFIDDVIYYFYQSRIHLNESLGKKNRSESYYIKGTVDSYDKETGVISFSFVLDINFKENTKKRLASQEGKTKGSKIDHYEVQFKNFPIELIEDPYYANDEGSWYVCTSFYNEPESLVDDEDWSISLHEDVEKEGLHKAATMYWNHTNPLEEVNIFDTDGIVDVNANAISAIEAFMCFESHYMQKEYWED